MTTRFQVKGLFIATAAALGLFLGFGSGAHAQEEEKYEEEYSKDVGALPAGVMVLARWLPKSPALDAGLEKGDVITEIDGTVVTSEKAYLTVLRKAGKEKKAAEFKILDVRSNYKKTVTRKIRPRADGWIGIKYKVIGE